jgi:hypothetical protein
VSEYLVPVVDVYTLACDTIAVAAPSEAMAVWEVLRAAPMLRYTGGPIERVELNEDNSTQRDVWHARYLPTRLKENAR